MVNSQPNIMVQYAKRYLDFDMVHLAAFNADREANLAKISADRNVAKQVVSKLLFSCHTEHPELKPLAKEVNALYEQLSKREELHQLLTLIREKKEKNTKGSFLAYIMQSEEHKCLMAIVKALQARDWSVGTLMYDGANVGVRAGLEIPCGEIEEAVLTATGYTIALKVKPFEMLDTSDFVTEAEDTADPRISLGGNQYVRQSEYLKAKVAFETDHFYFEPNDTIVEVRGNQMAMYSTMHASHAWGNTFTAKDESKADVKVMGYWLATDKTRKTYRKMSFLTGGGDDVFVRPIGFAFEKVTAAVTVSVLPKFDELLDHVCNRNAELKTYLTKWLAHMIQKPTVNAGTAIIVSGEQGTGKDLLGEVIGQHVVGREFFHDYTSSEQFWDRYDCGTEGKVFVKLQEAVGYLAHQNAGRFKARITAPMESYNPKGVKAYEVENLAHYYVTTNEACPVKMEKTDRRFVLIQTGSYKRGDKVFWDDLAASLLTKEAGAEIGAWLKAMPLTGYSTKDIPQTEFRTAMIENEADPNDQFVESWSGDSTKSADLFDSYRMWCIENHYSAASVKGWGMKMAVLVARGTVQKIKKNNGAYYEKPTPVVAASSA
jgi:hypothetical protein